MSRKRFAHPIIGWGMWTLSVTIVLCVTGRSFSQQAAPAGPATPRLSSKQEAIKWLDHFATQQMLYSDKEVDRIRRKLARSTPEQARQWLDKTRTLRGALDSPRWQKTREWLRQFLEVQAIYNDQQIAQFRHAVKRMSPDQVRKLMDDIEAKRTSMVRASASANQLRQQMLRVNRAYRQDQFAQREAARQAASRAAAQQRPRSSPSVARQKLQKPPPPLVDSLDVARWSVLRSLYPRW